MATTSCCIRTGIVYTTLEAPMEKTRNCHCRMVYHGVISGPESKNCIVDFRHMVIGIAICLSFKACSIYWCILLRYTTEQNIFFFPGMLLYLLENCTRSCIENCWCFVIVMGEFLLLLCYVVHVMANKVKGFSVWGLHVLSASMSQDPSVLTPFMHCLISLETNNIHL